MKKIFLFLAIFTISATLLNAMPENKSNGIQISYISNSAFFILTSLLSPESAPKVSGRPPSNITANSAVAGGNVTSDGGSPITERGIVFSTSDSPTINDNKVADINTGLGAYSCTMTGLIVNTNYFVRAYAINKDGISYAGGSYGFKPVVPPSKPTLVYPTNNEINVPINDSLKWNNVPGAIIYHSQISTDSNFNTNIIYDHTYAFWLYAPYYGLSGNTKYYWRVQASNFTNYSEWSDVWCFSTVPSAPSVNTLPLSNITQNSVLTGGNVTNKGGSDVTERGVVWAVTQNPTINNYKQPDIEQGSGSFTCLITGLKPATFYYVRAYAINSLGAAYGNSCTFITCVASPAPTLVFPSDDAVYVPLNGQVTWNGVSGADKYRVQISTTQDFLTTKADASNITGLNYNYSGLSDNQDYYWRVTAHYSNGWSNWSDVWHFSTGGSTPTVTTTAPTNIASTTAQTGGNVTSDGGATVTDRGIIYSSIIDPTLTNYPDGGVISAGTGTGSYNTAIMGLSPNTEYYVRAYATNSSGTSYGSSVSFTTKIMKPTLLSPDNNSIGIAADGILSWEPFTGATNYHLQVSTHANFDSTVIDESGYTSTDYSYSGLQDSITYYWQVSANNANGQGDWSDIWNFTTESQISVRETNEQSSLRLSCNPNPISTEAYIKVNFPSSSHVIIKIFNSLGMSIEALLDSYMESGTFNIKWNPNKLNLPNGIYFCEIIAGNKSKVIPLIYYKK